MQPKTHSKKKAGIKISYIDNFDKRLRIKPIFNFEKLWLEDYWVEKVLEEEA